MVMLMVMDVKATTTQPEPKPKAAVEVVADQSAKEASPASTGRYSTHFVFFMCNLFTVLKLGLLLQQCCNCNNILFAIFVLKPLIVFVILTLRIRDSSSYCS